ncbi:hypothetical protein KCTC32420_00162 [Aequorivita nionensis]
MNNNNTPTPCKNNCLVLAYSENPADFPLVRSIFSKLVAYTRNYPYTQRCAQAKKDLNEIKNTYFINRLNI